MFSHSKYRPSSKLARFWRGSCYGVGFAASTVFLFVMIWILWCYLGFTSLPTAISQRRAIVDYGTTSPKPIEATPSTPLGTFLQRNSTLSSQTNIPHVRGSSRGETEGVSDQRRDYVTNRREDGSAKGDFNTRNKSTPNSTNINARNLEGSRDVNSRASIIISTSEYPSLSDDNAKKVPTKGVTETVKTTALPSATESRSSVGDRRFIEEKLTDENKRIDDTVIRNDKERPRRPPDRSEGRSLRDDEPLLTRSDAKRDDLDKRPVEDSSSRRADDRPVDKDYSRDRPPYERADYPRRIYEGEERNNRRDYDRKEDDKRDYDRKEYDRRDYDRTEDDRRDYDRKEDDKRYDPKVDSRRYSPKDDDRIYGPKDDDRRYDPKDDDRRSDPKANDRRYDQKDDDRRYDRKADDDRRYDRKDDDDRRYDRKEDDRNIKSRSRDEYLSSRERTRDVTERSRDERDREYINRDDRYREDIYAEERYRSRSPDERYRDSDYRYRRRYEDDRYEARKGDDGRDDRYKSSDDYYGREDRYRDKTADGRYRDDDRSRDYDRRYEDKLPEDEDSRRRDDRYRSSVNSEVRRREDVRPRESDRKYRDESSNTKDRTSYRDDIGSETSTRFRSDTSDYLSGDKDRNPDDEYRTKDSILPSRREDNIRSGSTRTRVIDESRYDDSERRRTRLRDERYDDRYDRDSLPVRRNSRDDYIESRSPVNRDDRTYDRERPVYLEEDRTSSKGLSSRSDISLNTRTYLKSDDDYVRNRPKTDSRITDDEYRSSRRRSDEVESRDRDDRYKKNYRDRSDYDDDVEGRSKGEYVRDRSRDRSYSRIDDDDRYSRRETRYDDRYPPDREVRLRENKTDYEDRRIEPSKTIPSDPPLRSSRGRSSDAYQTEPRYYDDEYKRPSRPEAEEDYSRRDSYGTDETRIYSSRGENRSYVRGRGSEGTRTPCTKRRNSFSDEPEGLSFRRIDDDIDDCDKSSNDRYLPSTASYTRPYEERRRSSSRSLTPKEIIDEAYRHTEEGSPREAIYPVYDPRMINITSPEVIRPNERRGTTITSRRRRRRREFHMRK